MAGILNYMYDPNQIVYAIVKVSDADNVNAKVTAVRKCKIIRVRFSLLVTTTNMTPMYDVQVEQNTGTIELEETDIFATLTEAVDEYELRIT